LLFQIEFGDNPLHQLQEKEKFLNSILNRLKRQSSETLFLNIDMISVLGKILKKSANSSCWMNWDSVEQQRLFNGINIKIKSISNYIKIREKVQWDICEEVSLDCLIKLSMTSDLFNALAFKLLKDRVHNLSYGSSIDIRFNYHIIELDEHGIAIWQNFKNEDTNLTKRKPPFIEYMAIDDAITKLGRSAFYSDADNRASDWSQLLEEEALRTIFELLSQEKRTQIIEIN